MNNELSTKNKSSTQGRIQRGGVSGVATPPSGQSCNIKCSTTDVLSHEDELIYLAKRLVVVVAKF